MLTRAFLTAAFLILIDMSSPALATDNGHLDGVWMSGRINTAVKKAIEFDWLSQGPVAQMKSVKVDTGKDNCYAQLTWRGQGSYVYDLVAYCLNGNGEWERGEFNAQLWELNDSKQSIGTDWGSLYFNQQGKFFHGLEAYNSAYVGYDGGMEITPKFDKHGAVRSISAKVNTGLIYAWDDSTQIGGTSRSGGLKLRYVNAESVPQGAKDCAEASTALCEVTAN